MPKSFTLAATAGVAPLDNVFDITNEMRSDPQWNIGAYWYMKVKCISNSAQDRNFAFAGGGPRGFLHIKCPASPAISEVEAPKNTQVLQADAETATLAFQYVDQKVWTSGNLTITDICLAPLSCDSYNCPPASKLKGAGLFGGSEFQCCKKKECQEEAVQCAPATQWDEAENYSSGKFGYDRTSCCVPKQCPADICVNKTEWKAKVDTAPLGSTEEECCEEAYCHTHECPSDALWITLSKKFPNGSSRRGSTDDACCVPRYCNNPTDLVVPQSFDCGPASDWRLKPDASSIRAFNKSSCCDQLKCDEVTCANDTQWAGHKANANMIVGNTVDECCEKRWCSSYTCSSDDKLKKLSNPGRRQGNSDEECCTAKVCKDYRCSDFTKWVPKAPQYAQSDLDRNGTTDEECCDPIWCLPEICDPASAWKPKTGVGSTGADRLQGNTFEQCCDATYCEDFVCDTDVNRTGKGTAWYKKIDTNTYKWQGSTNEECCTPLYCSQYTTSRPSRWIRKKDPSLQGSTDEECYLPRLCSDYCCAGDDKELVPNPEKHMGSTDRECCVAKVDVPAA
eukprot:TRINITY_DN36257_c0_g1_i1.p1 TRINITY_DN36257_c0_g1~~TRINITY_DN36257_c0_g1_i1.p1  ORF type:complete len:660 (+),score=120.14 TRINITY_DN36257_c0_g1_i1:288-1982(+)